MPHTRFQDAWRRQPADANRPRRPPRAGAPFLLWWSGQSGRK